MSGFTQVQRNPVSGAVFDQIAGQVLDGSLPAGALLPPERILTQEFGVNRQALREALQRLAQLGLVEIRHGGATRVCDWRASAGLDLLPLLLIRADGAAAPQVVRAIMEMRAAVGADAAALCALRGGEQLLRDLRAAVADLVHCDPVGRVAADTRFWDLIVDGSGNVCYRLALNGLRASYRQAESLVHQVLTPEHNAVDRYRAVAQAIASRDAPQARYRAAALLELGTAAMSTFLPDPSDISTRGKS
ncbi:FadR/GntR family transcriptional regulator [Streptacidiphilus rugosus]|uniref:FadR/GntR family transcriptional regulator n=1 Tax=Streptacidiphilus rugosus TaxID=405783 RepID=UPI00068DB799|nr:GntR family transcriptional regulator [Streptacidiphilus rugosus]